MPKLTEMDMEPDHVWPRFKWAKRPECSCGMLIDAIEEEKFVFVSNFTGGADGEKSNSFYMMPVNSDGYFARSGGIVISHCPWCGDKIVGLKDYSKKR